MKVKTFYEVEVWQLAIDLAERIYKFCKFLPTEERFVLCDQMRRSSSSIAFNIAEGQKRFSTKDFIRFLSIARGSLGELLTQLILCNRIGYLPEEDFLRAKKRCEIIDIKLYNLAKSLSHKTDRNKIISATNKKSQKNN
ncbi:MAG: four helix bundle protein, partial [Candidatus Riflebacteria bacterium]|nr:four helix bundle protein [Candidatus Riflebacteria bacterium]